jgi:Bacterial mobilisation protein (MobC)
LQRLCANSIKMLDSLPAAVGSQFASMVTESRIAARVTADMKERFAALARHRGLSESTLLKRLIEASLVSAGAVQSQAIDPVDPVCRGARVSVRLRPDDLLLLRERARGRQMPTSTYLSLLTRAHLRALTPLPSVELAALKCSVAEISAMGRNLNQIARAVNRGEPLTGPSLADLRAIMKALWALVDRTKALIAANLESWRTGYEKAPD